MNNLPANALFSVYEIILLRIVRQDISSSHMFLLEFQLDKWPENCCCKNFYNIWLSTGNLLTSCVRSKSFQLLTKDGIPTQLLLIYSSPDRFQVTIAVWVYVIWNNRDHWKFSANKKVDLLHITSRRMCPSVLNVLSTGNRNFQASYQRWFQAIINY